MIALNQCLFGLGIVFMLLGGFSILKAHKKILRTGSFSPGKISSTSPGSGGAGSTGHLLYPGRKLRLVDGKWVTLIEEYYK